MQIILLNATVAEKDVELRKAHLEIRQLLRRLAPRRGLPSYAVSNIESFVGEQGTCYCLAITHLSLQQ